MNRLTIGEYNCLGDLSPSSPQEPPHAVQRIPTEGVSKPLTENTRLITLFSTFGGEFATFDDTNWDEGDPVPDTVKWVPIQPQYEVLRIVHMNATFRIAFRDVDHSA